VEPEAQVNGSLARHDQSSGLGLAGMSGEDGIP
jgi:hypothetical protein